MVEMSDSEFLTYCEGMANTPRCGFVPAHVARLIRLAGYPEENAIGWENKPVYVVELDQHAVRDAVTIGRARLAAQSQQDQKS